MKKSSKIIAAIISLVILTGLIIGAVFLFKKDTPTYEITVTANMGNERYVSGAGSYEEGKSVTIKAKDVTGYTFTNWKFNNEVISSNKEHTFKATKQTEGTYTANYTPINYQVAKSGNNAFTINNSADFKSIVTISNVEPAANGYKVRTYYVLENTSTQVEFETSFFMPAGNVTVFVEYVLVDYKITYNLDGGSISDAKSTYTLNDETFNLPTPTKPNYLFAGWTSDDIKTPTKSVSIVKGSTGDKIFVAHWESKIVTVYGGNESHWFHNDAEISVGSGQVKSGEELYIVTSFADAPQDKDYLIYYSNSGAKYVSNLYYRIDGDSTKHSIKDNKIVVPIADYITFYTEFKETKNISVNNVIYACNPITKTAEAVGYSNSDVVINSKITYNSEEYTVEGINFNEAHCGIKTITIPEGIKYINKISSETAYYQIKNLVLPSTLMHISTNLNNNISCANILQYNLETISVASGNAIYEDKNSNCIIRKSNKELVLGCKNSTIDSSVKIIGYSAFYDVNLNSITIPYGVEVIKPYAFYYSRITEISIPESVTKIGYRSFASTKITSIFIPTNVEEIGSRAFEYCDKLTEIKVSQYNNVYKSENLQAIIEKETNKLIATIDNTVPSSVEILGDRCFINPSNVTELTLSAKIKDISSLAIDNVYNLTTLVIDCECGYVNLKKNINCYGYNLVTSYKPTTIKVLKTLVDNPNLTNEYLNNTSNYTKTTEGNYYIYTLKTSD